MCFQRKTLDAMNVRNDMTTQRRGQKTSWPVRSCRRNCSSPSRSSRRLPLWLNSVRGMRETTLHLGNMKVCKPRRVKQLFFMEIYHSKLKMKNKRNANSVSCSRHLAKRSACCLNLLDAFHLHNVLRGTLNKAVAPRRTTQWILSRSASQ